MTDRQRLTRAVEFTAFMLTGGGNASRPRNDQAAVEFVV